MMKMADASAEPRSDFQESLWNTTAPLKMGGGWDPNLPDQGEPGSRGAPLLTPS